MQKFCKGEGTNLGYFEGGKGGGGGGTAASSVRGSTGRQDFTGGRMPSPPLNTPPMTPSEFF